MKAFKGPAKQRGFIGAALGLLGGAADMFGGAAQSGAFDAAEKNIKSLPGQDTTGISGNFGQVGANGRFTGSEQFQGQQNQLAQGSNAMLQGGMFNDPGLQQALSQNNMAGALGQANQAFGAQSGNTQFGGMQNLYNNMQGQLGQDFSGGMQQNLFNQGMQNQMAAGDQSALFNQSLNTQRQAAAPELARQQQAMEQSLFGKGMFGAGTTQTGEGYRGLFEAQGAQDLAMQNNAFGQANQQAQFLAGLGGQQMGQGQQFLGQNLGQYNNTAQNLMNLEGQGFNQNLQGMGFNSSQGQNRLNAAQGMFGLGQDTFAQNFGLGLQGAGMGLDYNRFGLDAARSPQELQAQLLSGGGLHAQAYAGMAPGAGQAKQGMFSGIADGLGLLGDFFG